MNHVPAEFLNVSTDTLRAWLASAQQALQDLTIGGKIEAAAYGQGDGGTKSVTYTRADIGALQQRISALAQLLTGGCRPYRRRPSRPLYL